MRLLGQGVFPATFSALVGLTTGGWLFAQKPITVQELSSQRATLDAKTVRIKGILASGHVGPLLKDERQQVAARLRFEALPQSARRERVVKDDLYRELFDLVDSIPDPDRPKGRYEIELLGWVKVLKKASYDVYSESPIEIYPLQVLRVVSMGPTRDRGGKAER